MANRTGGEMRMMTDENTIEQNKYGAVEAVTFALKKYGVSTASISGIWNNKTWKHI